jgi:hypothetical protein
MKTQNRINLQVTIEVRQENILEMLAELTAKAENGFGINPESANWAQAGDLGRIEGELAQLLAVVNGTAR